MKRVFVIAFILFSLLLLGFSFPQQQPQLISQPIAVIDSANEDITYSGIYSTGTIVCTPASEQYKFQLYVWNRANDSIPLTIKNVENLVRQIDGIVFSSAMKNGGSPRRILFDVDKTCTPIVLQVIYTPTDNFKNDIWAITTKLWTTFTRPIVIVSPMDEACGATWVYNDSQKNLVKNLAYRMPVGTFISSKCVSAPVIAHEIVHALGGVQNDAPNSDGTFHCTDSYDVVCRHDNSTIVCPQLELNILFDCNGDDYFSTFKFESENSTIPLPYLQTHLNIADSPFLAGEKYLHKLRFPMVR